MIYLDRNIAMQKSISSSRGVSVANGATTEVVAGSNNRIGLIVFPDPTNPTQIWWDTSSMPSDAGVININSGPMELNVFDHGDIVRHTMYAAGSGGATQLTVVETIGPDCDCGD
jgi:hypothetical protein